MIINGHNLDKMGRLGGSAREEACFPPPPAPLPARAASRAPQPVRRSRVTARAALKPTSPKGGVGAEAVAWIEAAASAGSIECLLSLTLTLKKRGNNSPPQAPIFAFCIGAGAILRARVDGFQKTPPPLGQTIPAKMTIRVPELWGRAWSECPLSLTLYSH